jgi:hypothetical protein
MPIGNSTLGSSLSITPTLSSLQIGNLVMPVQMSNGGSATGNLCEGGTVDQQYVDDQVNNSNDVPEETS